MPEECCKNGRLASECAPFNHFAYSGSDFMPDNYKATESENHTANILKQLDKFRFDIVAGMRRP